MAVMLPPSINPWQQMATQYGQGQLDIGQVLKAKQQEDLMNQLRQMQMENIKSEMAARALDRLFKEREYQELNKNITVPFRRTVPETDPMAELESPTTQIEEPTEPVNLRVIKALGEKLTPIVYPQFGQQSKPSFKYSGGRVYQEPGPGETGIPKIVIEAPPKEQGGETSDIKNFQAWNKVPENENKTFQDYLMFKAGLNKSGFQIEVDKDGNIRVTQGELGKTDITTQTKGILQQDTIKLIEQASSMRKIGQDFKKDYLTYWGRIKQYGLNVASKGGIDIGTENKEFVSGMRTFIERVEAFYQRWRKEITGAQAVMKEIEMLRESVLNKKISPDEFEASYTRMMNDIELSLRLKQELMQKGFKGNELGQKIDELFAQRKTQLNENVTETTLPKGKTMKLSTGKTIIITED